MRDVLKSANKPHLNAFLAAWPGARELTLGVVRVTTKIPRLTSISDIAGRTSKSLNYDGCGVAHIDGKVTFVEDALPNETVQAALPQSAQKLRLTANWSRYFRQARIG